MIKVLIYLEVAFNKAFLKSAGNLANYAKSLGYEMKCDTYDNDSPDAENEIFDSFKTVLKTLFKPFPILFTKSSDTFH